ncbi:hypothetical protein GGX14DRAFT_386430 [Mycena pura]|uniref:Uncharacterized protein n=1 Tax=Mycena pura TaxID=153505 RepID=A0AAD7E2W0_9AGAR|nr:hypothetical protein GGX14DRAFT_386430 [Mycena pura]
MLNETEMGSVLPSAKYVKPHKQSNFKQTKQAMMPGIKTRRKRAGDSVYGAGVSSGSKAAKTDKKKVKQACGTHWAITSEANCKFLANTQQSHNQSTRSWGRQWEEREIQVKKGMEEGREGDMSGRTKTNDGLVWLSLRHEIRCSLPASITFQRGQEVHLARGAHTCKQEICPHVVFLCTLIVTICALHVFSCTPIFCDAHYQVLSSHSDRLTFISPQRAPPTEETLVASASTAVMVLAGSTCITGYQPACNMNLFKTCMAVPLTSYVNDENMDLQLISDNRVQSCDEVPTV